MEKEFDQIFTLLSNEEFKDPATGLLFFPAYIYTYDPRKEYEIRKEIVRLNKKLERPSNSLNSLLINIYEKFIDYLKSDDYAGKSLFDQILEMEKSNPEEAEEWAKEEAQSDEFLDYLGEEFKNYFDPDSQDKIYLLIYGFGTIFPYLRVSHFLKSTEKFIKHFKLIVFYPGEFSTDNYSLFGHFNDDNLYRANHLNQLLQK